MISPVEVMVWFGSRRKELVMRVGRVRWMGVVGEAFSGVGDCEGAGGEREGGERLLSSFVPIVMVNKVVQFEI
jgi:hypothetical protein